MSMMEQTLIKAVQKFACLYDKNDKFYKDIRVKDAAWKEVAAITKTSASDCKRIWTIMRDSLRRVIKKRINSRDDSYKKQWKYEEEMSFLLPYIHTRPVTRLSGSGSEDEDSMQAPAAVSVDSDARLDTLAAEDATVAAAATTAAVRSVTYRPRRVSAMRTQLMHDDIDAFFRSMAATVKTFPPRQRILAKQRVFNVVSKLELELCLSGVESNPLETTFSPSSHQSWQDVKVELEEADEQMLIYD